MDSQLEADILPQDSEKFCSKCKALVPLDLYHKQQNNLDGLSYWCKDCAQVYAKQRYKRHKKMTSSSGLCNTYGCKTKAFMGGRLCAKHFYKNTSANRLGHGGFAKELEVLAEKQNYICSITGDKLVPTVNMSLDHIKPVSKYPEVKGDINNVQWVTKWANAAKWDLSINELISQCEKVIAQSNKNKD